MRKDNFPKYLTEALDQTFVTGHCWGSELRGDENAHQPETCLFLLHNRKLRMEDLGGVFCDSVISEFFQSRKDCKTSYLLKKHYPFHLTESYHNLASRNSQLGELLSGHIHCQPMLSVQTCTVKKKFKSFEHHWLADIWVKCLCKFFCCSEAAVTVVGENSPYGVWCWQKSHM